MASLVTPPTLSLPLLRTLVITLGPVLQNNLLMLGSADGAPSSPFPSSHRFWRLGWRHPPHRICELRTKRSGGAIESAGRNFHVALDCKLCDDVVGSEPTHFWRKRPLVFSTTAFFMSEMTCDLKGRLSCYCRKAWIWNFIFSQLHFPCKPAPREDRWSHAHHEVCAKYDASLCFS